MHFIRKACPALLLLLPFFAGAQSTYLDRGSKYEHFVDRMEIKQATNTHLNFSTLKPFSRRSAVEEIQFLDSAREGYPDSLGQDMFADYRDLRMTDMDEYNMQNFLRNNSEWVTVPKVGYESERPLGPFYKTKANFLEVNAKDFFLAVNPMLTFNWGKESNNDESVYYNSRGVSARGLIAKKVGFSAFLTDNQERGPLFYRQLVDSLRAVPGVGFYKEFKNNAKDYFDARGYVTFGATKYIQFQLGFDKNFIGNGYRSLFLSDFGNSYLFAKINTRIWKLNYQNLFMELMPQFYKTHDTLLDRKYAAMHHLSMNVTNWLNIGLFEGVVFSRRNHFDFSYLNPIIFYRHIEGNNGSPDNAVLGLDFIANVAHTAQVYGQFLMDEFILSKVKNDPTNWVNKFGIQAGVKYVDAFDIKNLDLQFEANRVRPFTYSHYDTVANYTHYNQPLAHPLGANFQEFIFAGKYQPYKRLFIDARAIYYFKGLDSAGVNSGGNIFRNYAIRSSENGFKVGSGTKYKCLNTMLTFSYELRDNLFIDLNGQYRRAKLAGNRNAQSSSIISAGLRWNMSRKVYDY